MKESANLGQTANDICNLLYLFVFAERGILPDDTELKCI